MARSSQAQAEADRDRARTAERLASERLEQVTRQKDRAERAEYSVAGSLAAEAEAKKAAQAAAIEAKDRLTRLYIVTGAQALERSEPSTALLWHVRAWEGDRDGARETDHRIRVGSAAAGFPRLTGICFHPTAVADAALDANGTRVLTCPVDALGTRQSQVDLWDPATSRLAVPPLTHAAPIRQAAFSPAGDRVATASDDRTAALWDPTTGKRLFSLTHPGRVLGLAFRPDGTMLATAGKGKTLRLWDTTTGQPTGPTFNPPADVDFVGFAPDGSRMVTSDRENKARVWDPRTGEQVGPAVEHVRIKPSEEQYYQTDPVLSPDGTLLLTNTATALTLWEIPAAKPTVLLKGRATGFQFSQDGKKAVIARASSVAFLVESFRPEGRGTVFPSASGLWCRSEPGWSDAGHYQQRGPGNRLGCPEREATLFPAQWCPCGAVAVLGRWPVAPGRGTGRDDPDLWTSRREHTCRSCPMPSIAAVPTCRVCTKTRRTARMDRSGSASRRKAPGSSAALATPWANSLPGTQEVAVARFSPDGRRVATSARDTVQAGTPRLVSRSDRPTGSPPSSPNPPVSRTSGGPPASRGWSSTRPAGGCPPPSPTSRSRRSTAGRLGPGRPTSGRSNPGVRSFSFPRASKSPPRQMPGSDGPRVSTLRGVAVTALSPDGRLLAVGTKRPWALSVHEVESGRLVFRREAQQGFYWHLEFSPDSRSVLVVSSDTTARVWDAGTGQPVSPSLQHTIFAVGGGFSPDGKRVVTTDGKGIVRIWDVRTGDTLLAAEAGAEGACWFGTDGRTVQFAAENELKRIRLPVFPGSVEDAQCLARLLTGQFLDETDGAEFIPPTEFIQNHSAYRKAWLIWNGLPDTPSVQ